MEKNNAVETSSGVAIAIRNDGGRTEMVKETRTTVDAGGNQKNDTIHMEKSELRKKASKLKKKKKKSVPKVVSEDSGETSADDETTAADVAVRSEDGVKGYRILVSNTKKPLLFYLNLSKRYIMQNNYVELSALGMAIPTVITIAEILKKDGWATERDVTISSEPLRDDANGRVIMKAKIGIILEKAEKFDKNGLIVVAKGESEVCENETEEFSSETNGKVLLIEPRPKRMRAWS